MWDKWRRSCLHYHAPVALRRGQDCSDQHENVDYSGIYTFIPSLHEVALWPSEWTPTFCFGLFWFGLVGLVWLVWLGLFGLAWLGCFVLVWFGLILFALFGLVWSGLIWLCFSLHCFVLFLVVFSCVVLCCVVLFYSCFVLFCFCFVLIIIKKSAVISLDHITLTLKYH